MNAVPKNVWHIKATDEFDNIHHKLTDLRDTSQLHDNDKVDPRVYLIVLPCMGHIFLHLGTSGCVIHNFHNLRPQIFNQGSKPKKNIK